MIVRIHARLRPAPDHAYVVPVVRELAPAGPEAARRRADLVIVTGHSVPRH